jgi:protease I
MNSSKVCKLLMLVGDFVEDYEVMVPFQAIQIFGHEIHVASPGKKKGDTVKTAIHDFEGDQTYTEKVGHNFQLNYDFDSVDETQYDGLIIPGGRAPEYLRLNERVIQITSYFLAENKAIAAICHGIQVLTATEKISGRSLTCYPALSMDLKFVGAKYQDISIDDAHVDGNLVTAKAWPAHTKWIQRFIEVLNKQN